MMTVGEISLDDLACLGIKEVSDPPGVAYDEIANDIEMWVIVKSELRRPWLQPRVEGKQITPLEKAQGLLGTCRISVGKCLELGVEMNRMCAVKLFPSSRPILAKQPPVPTQSIAITHFALPTPPVRYWDVIKTSVFE
jgi:hypothetical protein